MTAHHTGGKPCPSRGCTVSYRKGIHDVIEVIGDLFHDDPCDCLACTTLARAQSALATMNGAK